MARRRYEGGRCCSGNQPCSPPSSQRGGDLCRDIWGALFGCPGVGRCRQRCGPRPGPVGGGEVCATAPAATGFGVAELQLDIDDAEQNDVTPPAWPSASDYGCGGLDVLMALPYGLPDRSWPSAITAGHWKLVSSGRRPMRPARSVSRTAEECHVPQDPPDVERQAQLSVREKYARPSSPLVTPVPPTILQSSSATRQLPMLRCGLTGPRDRSNASSSSGGGSPPT